MRRIMLLTLLALALPTVALANPVKVFTLGDFQSGTITGSLTNGGSFDILVVGNSETPFFFFDIGTLTQFHRGCDPSLDLKACFTFKTGSIVIKNSLGATVLTTGLTGGQLLEGTNGGSTPWIFAFGLKPNFPLNSGGGHTEFGFTGNTLTAANSVVFAGYALVPDASPGTLGLLLGTGLIGIPGIMRRKQT